MLDVVLKDLVGFFAKHLDFIIGVVINIALIYAFCKIIDIFHRNIEKNLKSKNSSSPLLNLLPSLNKIAKAIIIFLLIAGFLQSFGYNVTSLIAGFGITGLAVGFAAKETIGNIFGSIGLLADKVYKIGEYVKFDGAEGTVESINLRSTSIRTVDGLLVNVPNNVISNEPITNFTQVSQRKIDVSIDIEYGTSNEKIDRGLEILKEIAEENDNIKDGYYVFIDNMAPSSIVLRIIAYTNATAYIDFVKVKSEVYRAIIHKFREEGIEFAFPSTSVYMAK
ncbi:MAG: mechanosensitive ion channel family protein [bacterium]|nr:mechanosensitive ion channel family protein [bacterium]